MGRKLGALFPFLGRGARSPSNTMLLGLRPTFLPSSILIHPAVWAQQTLAKNWGALPPFWGGGAGSLSNRMSLGSRPTFLPSGILIHWAIWPQQIWAENWGFCPSYTMWPGPRPTCVPSLILIRPTVWPQYKNVTERTDRQTDRQTDNNPIAQGEPFYKGSPKNYSHCCYHKWLWPAQSCWLWNLQIGP